MPHTRSVRVWDIVLSIVLMLAMFAVAAFALIFALFLPMVSDGCGIDCNVDQIQVGFMLALLLPPLLITAATVTTIVLLVKRRLAYWVPLAGIGAVVVSGVAGSAIAMLAVPSFFS
ncbi:hypothetical protein GCM10022381_10310 [Leifsonia kafniensis]|uniref:Integral membrane protein n=1 Tax=Leifsonia kafniensis TaxID=475957 RepID=A0ABP7K9R1_9MICO